MRIKDLSRANTKSLTDSTEPSYTFRYIDIGNVSNEDGITLSEEMTFSEAPSRARRIVSKGDVLVSTVRTYLKAISTINFEAEDIIASTGFAVLTPNKDVCPEFLAYVVKTDSVIDEICKKSYGVSYPAINTPVLCSIAIPFYEKNIQNRIVNYLDSKVSAIYNQVNLLSKKRDTYLRLKKSIINDAITKGLNPNVPMKNSGIDWIGMIPLHWNTRRIKEISKMFSGTTPKSTEMKYYEGGTHPWINTSNVQDGEINAPTFYVTDIAMHDYSGLKYIPKDTVLLAMYGGGTIGNVAVMNFAATINQACCAMTTNRYMLPKFLFYFLLKNKAMIYLLTPLHKK